jgi:hypothetical protein
MASFKELIGQFGNGHVENIVFSLSAGESVVCHFKDSGIDNATDKYFGLTSEAKKVAISVSKAAAITHINGIALKSPRTIPTGGLVHRNGIEWGKITIRSDQDATTFEVYAS